jgi:hypothetical protein
LTREAAGRTQDARGCLTDDGFALLEGAAPGRAPAELAGHVARCARCQGRWLAASAPPQRAARGRPPAWRGPVLALLLLIVLLLALFTLARLI